jgi:hypothetical protein
MKPSVSLPPSSVSIPLPSSSQPLVTFIPNHPSVSIRSSVSIPSSSVLIQASVPSIPIQPQSCSVPTQQSNSTKPSVSLSQRSRSDHLSKNNLPQFRFNTTFLSFASTQPSSVSLPHFRFNPAISFEPTIGFNDSIHPSVKPNLNIGAFFPDPTQAGSPVVLRTCTAGSSLAVVSMTASLP